LTALPRQRGGVALAASRFLRAMALILLYYLFQVSVMPHLKVLGVVPNLLMVVIAIMTVSYGKLYAFITGATLGIVLEAMAMTIPLFYVLIYPVLALLCAQVFSDMTDVKREIRRVREAQRQSEAAAEIKAPFKRGKFRFRLRRTSPYDLNAHLRILLNALMLVGLYEGVMLIYIALVGIPVGAGHFLRVFYTLAYTALCCVTMFPARAFLGLYRRPRRFAAPGSDAEIATGREALRQMALVPDEAPEPPQTRRFGFPHRKPKDRPAPPPDPIQTAAPESDGKEENAQ